MKKKSGNYNRSTVSVKKETAIKAKTIAASRGIKLYTYFEELVDAATRGETIKLGEEK